MRISRQRPRSHCYKQPVSGRSPQQPDERLDRLRISPMKIIKAKQHRSSLRFAIKQLPETLGRDEGVPEAVTTRLRRCDTPLQKNIKRRAAALQGVRDEDMEVARTPLKFVEQRRLTGTRVTDNDEHIRITASRLLDPGLQDYELLGVPPQHRRLPDARPPSLTHSPDNPPWSST
jgi:hypothetical protein